MKTLTAAKRKPKVALVVMAGGSGTRFWPRSTSKMPKQLLSFGKGEPALVVKTLQRFKGIADRQVVVTTKALKTATRRIVPKSVEVWGEPSGRNTAPTVYWVCREIAMKDPETVLLLMPADHAIADVASFRTTVANAAELANRHALIVALGIEPTRPETGYGYLKTGVPFEAGSLRLERFVEKPDLARAQSFLDTGGYLWNGGMYAVRVSTLLAEFDEHMPEMREIWDRYGKLVERAYPHLTSTSVDYGVMEKTKSIIALKLTCGWDDLGSWTAMETLKGATQVEGGCVLGGVSVSVDSTGNLIDAPGRLVGLLGVHNLIIVEHNGALLIADKRRAQDVKKIVELVKPHGKA